MRRRSVLVGILSGVPALGGCLSDAGNREVADVEDPPEWLQQRADCPNGYVKESLELSEKIASVDDSAAVVAFSRLSEDAKLPVRFAVSHGTAQTCTDTGAVVFMALLADIMEHARRPYREEHGEQPKATVIRADGGYYRVVQLDVYDQVLR